MLALMTFTIYHPIGTNCKILENPLETDIVISSTVSYQDQIIRSDLVVKAIEAHELVKAICCRNKWEFINHKSVNRSCLNSRGVHLNSKGTSVVAKNIKWKERRWRISVLKFGKI